jgi:hypothetical protein
LIHDSDLEVVPIISNSTSEHEVRGRPSDQRVLKKTWPGFFGSDLRLEGVNISDRPSMIIGERSGTPSFVVSQRFISAANPRIPKPSEPQIAAFLEAHGFASLARSYFGWVRRADGVVVLDARADNFILSAEGVVPIDLQMAVIPELLASEGE